jgi:transposase
MPNSKPKLPKYTLRDFEKQFPNDDACLEWLKDYLYPNGIHCEKCQKVTKHHKVASRRSYSCDYCGHHVHPTADTIYHKSSTPLRLWFYAIYLMASTRCGIAAKQLERELGVTYKTAWRMFKQIRSMLADENAAPLAGRVEVDETYVGGKPRYANMPGRGRGLRNKKIVVGAVERGGRAVARHIKVADGKTLLPFIKENVKAESTVYTDENNSYWSVRYNGYEHYTIKHKEKIYALGHIHTNTIEGYWSLVKGGLKGVYRNVSDKYLQTYFNEYSFRYNRRNDDKPMFISFLTQVEKATTD